MVADARDNSQPGPAYNPIFERLVDDGGLQGIVAYGLYKIAKREWVADLRLRESRKPTDSELDAYTRTWTAAQLSGVQERAAQVLAEYAATIIQEEEPRILRRALRGHFWRQVWPSVFASFVYTLILIALALVLAWSNVDLLDVFRAVSGRS